MKTKAILIAAFFSAGLLFASCNKGGELAPSIVIYPEEDTLNHVPPITNTDWRSLVKEKETLDKVTQ